MNLMNRVIRQESVGILDKGSLLAMGRGFGLLDVDLWSQLGLIMMFLST